MITTTAGPVSTEELGPTLMHEHLYVNLLREYREHGLVNDPELMRTEVATFRLAGGRTIVDVTPAELTMGAFPGPGKHEPRPEGLLSRHPANVEAIADLARVAGVNVVLSTGHYRDPYLDGAFATAGVDRLREAMVGDLEQGFPGTDVRAGIIGEIGADKWYVSPAEERSFRAAGEAQLVTGAAITTHAARWPVGVAQVEILTGMGVDPGRVVVGHVDTVAEGDYPRRLADLGVYVQFDMLRGASDYSTGKSVQQVTDLVRRGHLGQVLLSHDNCLTSHLHAFGGRGFDYVLTGFRDALLEAGLTAEQFDTILTTNPAAVLQRQGSVP